MRYLQSIFIVLIILLGITFACLNAESVSINYYIGIKDLPLSLLLAFVLLIGSILGFLVCCPLIVKLKAQKSQLAKRISLVEQEVSNLRAIPLKDDH